MLIEHRMQVVMEMSDWIYVMNFGRLLAQGRPEEIQKNPEVIKAYIGEDDQDA
jgi:branched-chain amino acid transport system ATP-binding protein